MNLPRRKPTLADFALIFFIILSGILFLAATSGKAPAAYATLTSADGSFRIDLSKDTALAVSSNGYDYIIEVSGGEIYVKDCNCPDGICKTTKAVGKRPGSIVCVPGKLMINCNTGGDSGENADFIIP